MTKKHEGEVTELFIYNKSVAKLAGVKELNLEKEWEKFQEKGLPKDDAPSAFVGELVHKHKIVQVDKGVEATKTVRLSFNPPVKPKESKPKE